jgi:head-tail adaptor
MFTITKLHTRLEIKTLVRNNRPQGNSIRKYKHFRSFPAGAENVIDDAAASHYPSC